MIKDQAIIDFMSQTAWALDQRVLRSLLHVVHRHSLGIKLSEDEIRQVTTERRELVDHPIYGHDPKLLEASPGVLRVLDGVGIIPIEGLVTKLAGSVNGSSQPRGTATNVLRKSLKMALADDDVHTIMLYVDSPGGSVPGTSDLARQIRAARARKPVVAFVDGMMASGAYWLGSQADEVVTNDTGHVGSIGVYTVLDDWHAFFEEHGVERHIIKAGKFKGMGIPGVKVTEGELEVLQREINHIYDRFVDAVATGRQMEAKDVLKIADGTVRTGESARAVGLVDRVETFDNLMGEITSSRGESVRRRDVETEPDEAETDEPAATSEEANVATKTKAAPDGGEAVSAGFDLDAHSAEETATYLREHHEDVVVIFHAEERERIAYIEDRCLEFQAELKTKLIKDGSNKAAIDKAIVDDIRDNHAERIGALETIRARSAGQAQAGDGSGLELVTPEEEFDEGAAGKAKVIVNGKTVKLTDKGHIDYTQLKGDEAIEEAAKQEFELLDKSHQQAIGGVENLVSLRKEEAREREWAEEHS